MVHSTLLQPKKKDCLQRSNRHQHVPSLRRDNFSDRACTVGNIFCDANVFEHEERPTRISVGISRIGDIRNLHAIHNVEFRSVRVNYLLTPWKLMQLLMKPSILENISVDKYKVNTQ